MSTVVNAPSYALPSDIRPEDITYVGICDDTVLTDSSRFKEYGYLRAEQKLSGSNWYIHVSDGGARGIGLYPVPTDSTSHIRLIYKKRPTMFTLLNVTAEPEIEVDWQMLLVYGAITEIAGSGSSPDISIVNNYTYKYNALLTEAKSALNGRDVAYGKTRDVYRPYGFSRRFNNNSVITEILYPNKTPNDIMTSADPA